MVLFRVQRDSTSIGAKVAIVKGTDGEVSASPPEKTGVILLFSTASVNLAEAVYVSGVGLRREEKLPRRETRENFIDGLLVPVSILCLPQGIG